LMESHSRVIARHQVRLLAGPDDGLTRATQ